MIFFKGNALCEICDSFNIHNLIWTVAYFKSSEGTLLDLCLVTKPLRLNNVLNLSCWLSDFHNFISVITKLHVPRRIPKVIQYRSMKNFQDGPFISDLYVLSNAVPYGLNDVTVCTSALIQHLYSIIESHAPTERRTICHNGVPFMNSQLWKLQHERNRARNIKTQFPTAEKPQKV